MSQYSWLLFLHLTGAFLLIGGSVVAGALSIAARGRERPSEVVLLMGLIRYAVIAIGIGSLLTLVFGLWLVHAAHVGYSYGDAWVIAALVLWAVAQALGGRGGTEQRHVRELAERLSAAGDTPSEELRQRLRDARPFVLNFGSGLLILVILVLMVWKPGA